MFKSPLLCVPELGHEEMHALHFVIDDVERRQIYRTVSGVCGQLSELNGNGRQPTFEATHNFVRCVHGNPAFERRGSGREICQQLGFGVSRSVAECEWRD
jgi:hypothetical protein